MPPTSLHGGAPGLPVPSTRPGSERDMSQAWSVNQSATPVEFPEGGGDPCPDCE